MRLVVALGGNALLRHGESPDARPQIDRLRQVSGSLAALARRHQLVIVHGNGPQAGLLASESAHDPTLREPYSLADVVAETQGLIGSWITRTLREHLRSPVVTLVTHVLVDPLDPAFEHPTKGIGPTFERARAEDLERRFGWTFRREAAEYRRVVPSPTPVRVLEVGTVGRLLEHDVTVVMGGGGGIPVVPSPQGWCGTDAVVDKDLTALEVAVCLDADRLVILTDVPQVVADRGTDHERPLGQVSAAELDPTRFAEGSMGPKVQAACGFVVRTGHRAAIGSLDEATAVIEGCSGTQVHP